mgnify:CR=1 FL=1
MRTHILGVIAGCLAYAVCSVTPVSAAESGESAGLMGAFANEPVSYEGGEVQYMPEKNAVALLGYATLSKGPLTVKARNMVYFRDTHEVYAEGRVTMTEPGGSTFECESLYFNVDERRGEANSVNIMGKMPENMASGGGASSLDSRPLGPDAKPGQGAQLGVSQVFVSANTIRSFSLDHQELHGVTLTNDNSPKPFIRISSNRAVMKRNEKVASMHNVLWFGKVPVFYFPYIIRDLRYDWPWMRFTAGNDNDWGTYALTTWGWDVDSNKDWYFRPEEVFFDIDYRQDRGAAFGVDLGYEMGHRESKGLIDTYWTREGAISDDQDWERAVEDTDLGDTYADEDRYKIEWRHYQELSKDWDIRAEAHYYSDRDFQKEYFEREYREEKEPETSIDLRQLKDHHVLEFVAMKRANDWQTQEEYLPEARLNIPGYAIGNTGFFVTSENRVGLINKRFDTADDEAGTIENAIDRVKHGDDYGNFFRASTDTRVSYPIRIAKSVTVTPYVGGLATLYEEAYDDQTLEDEGNVRAAGLYGVAASTALYNKFRLRGNEWRHVVEPTIAFDAKEDPTIDPKALYDVDELDEFHEEHLVSLKLHQKFQTKRNGAIIDVLDLDFAANYLPEEGEQDTYNHGEAWKSYTGDVVWRPIANLVTWGDFEYIPADNAVTEASIGADWRFNNLFRVFAEQRYERGHTWDEPDLDKSSETTTGVRMKIPGGKYTLEYAVTYESAQDGVDVEHGFNKQRVSLIRNIKVFDLGFSYVRDERDDDEGFYITLTPVGIDPHDRGIISDDAMGRRFDGRYHPAMDNEINMEADATSAPQGVQGAVPVVTPAPTTDTGSDPE